MDKAARIILSICIGIITMFIMSWIVIPEPQMEITYKKQIYKVPSKGTTRVYIKNDTLHVEHFK
jgi:hypothetical protein